MTKDGLGMNEWDFREITSVHAENKIQFHLNVQFEISAEPTLRNFHKEKVRISVYNL